MGPGREEKSDINEDKKVSSERTDSSNCWAMVVDVLFHRRHDCFSIDSLKDSHVINEFRSE